MWLSRNTPQFAKQNSTTFLCYTWHLHRRRWHSPCVNPWPGSVELTDTDSSWKNSASPVAQLHRLHGQEAVPPFRRIYYDSFLATAEPKSYRLSWRGGGSWGKTVIWSTLPLIDLCLVLHPNFSNWEINNKNKSKGEMGLSQDKLTVLHVPDGDNYFYKNWFIH